MFKGLAKWFSNLSVAARIGIVLATIAVVGTVGASGHNPPTTTPSKSAQTKSQVETNNLTTTVSIPFTSSTVQDNTLAQGTTKTKTAGINGEKTQTWAVTYTNGQETSRKLVSEVVTTASVNEVIAQGTYVAPTPSPAPAPSSPSSCTPLTNGGNCYEPGEYCRNSDHGLTGIAGDGESIVCTDNNGWRWEPN